MMSLHQDAPPEADKEAEDPSFPKTESELVDAIEREGLPLQEAEHQAKGIMCQDAGALSIYEKRCAEIKALKATLGANEETLNAALAQIESVKAAWLPNLKDLISRISDAFQESFKIIGSVGMVKLLEPEDEKDEKYFDKFEAQILVKFRDGEPLQVLNPQRQSGGERSVSTMLFMISLQDLTACPFRVVDEINQGMDPKNERRIFQEMVLSSSQPKTAQCFLLTPKLLQQLDYGEHTTILNIMSGPEVSAVARKWDRSLMFSGVELLVK